VYCTLKITAASREVWSTRHNAVKRDSQLVTRFYGVSGWPCDKLTGSQWKYAMHWGNSVHKGSI